MKEMNHNEVDTSVKYILSTTLLFVLSEVVIVCIHNFMPDGQSLLPMFIILYSLYGIFFLFLVNTEIIRKVKTDNNILLGSLFILILMVLYFTLQYYLLESFFAGSFSNTTLHPIDMVFHTTMIFLLNPMTVPQTMAAKILMLITVSTSFVYVVFLLQNMWHLRGQK